MNDVIAYSEMVCVDQAGKTTRLTARIGRPLLVGDGEYACPVNIEGLYSDLADIRGIDSLQALSLAVQFVGKVLQGVVEQGNRILEPASGKPLDLDAWFLKMSA